MAELSSILAERGARYGSFRGHAEIVEGLLKILESTKAWPTMDATKRQGLRAIFDKIARIANGNAEYDDSWRDIAGYATLVLNDLLDPSTPSGEFVATPMVPSAVTAPLPKAVEPLPKITPPAPVKS